MGLAISLVRKADLLMPIGGRQRSPEAVQEELHGGNNSLAYEYDYLYMKRSHFALQESAL